MNFSHVTFGEYDSWRDWGLILTGDDVGFPKVSALIDDMKIYGVDADQYDVERDRRKLSFTFLVRDAAAWPEVVTRVTAALHGKKKSIIRSSEPEYTYIGRCVVDRYRTSKAMGTLVIAVDAEPYKYKAYVTEEMLQITGKTITVDTKYITPAIVTIRPAVTDIVSITLNGLARNPVTGEAESIMARNLAAGEELVINGELCTVTSGDVNRYGDMEMWEFPNLKEGNQIISASNGTCNITVRYRPRYI